MYIHRVGRTGRAGKSGVSILLYDNNESRDKQECEQIAVSKVLQINIYILLPALYQLQALEPALNNYLHTGYPRVYNDSKIQCMSISHMQPGLGFTWSKTSEKFTIAVVWHAWVEVGHLESDVCQQFLQTTLSILMKL